MTKVLVTGANGFIGKPLVKALELEDIYVITLNSNDGDIANKDTWKKLSAVDTVIHLAGRSYVPDSWKDPAGFIDTNVNGTRLALDYCKKYQSKLIFVSAYIYGNPEKLPIHELDRLSPNNPYALSKYIAERLCQFYSSHWNIAVTVIRPFNVFGPEQRQDFLIPKILKQIKESNIIQVNNLEPRRDYVYIDDLIQALVNALKVTGGFNVVNIGSGVSYSVRELIDIIQDVVGTNLPVYSKKIIRKQEIYEVQADIRMADKLLNWKPRYDLTCGIKKILQTE